MLSSHILKEVEMTCDRILIIDRGEIVADGPTEELRQQFMGGTRLRVQVDAPAEADVAGNFEALDGIASVQRTEGHYELAAAGDTDPAARVFRLCADREWVLTELTPLESSLEDVFRELTEARDAPAGATSSSAADGAPAGG
jgi:ABC-2 type transport system ATP-binding protein